MKKHNERKTWVIDESSGWGAGRISFPKRMFLAGLSLGLSIGISVSLIF